MGTALYIARKFIKGKGRRRVSRPIITISIISVMLGFCVMVLSAAVSQGFQRQVRDKVIGFGSHIRIEPLEMSTQNEAVGVPIDQPFTESLRNEPGVAHVQASAAKPGIMQTPTDTLTDSLGAQTVEYSIQGVLVRGAGPDFNWDFFSDKLVEGRLPAPGSEQRELLISKTIATRMKLQPGTRADIYFIRNGKPSKRQFMVSGVYQTGLEDFDREIVFADLDLIQQLNGWGARVMLELKDTCLYNSFVIEARADGGSDGFLYDWGDGSGWSADNLLRYCPVSDTTIRVIAAGYVRTPTGMPEVSTLPDTAWITLKTSGTVDCQCPYPADTIIPAEYSQDGMQRTLLLPAGSISASVTTSGGSHRLYTNAFEVQLSSWDHLKQSAELIARTHTGPGFRTVSIVESHPEIFSWLDMLDTNVIIIMVLVIMVSVITMSSTMLVLILERTNAIGILKAMGATNWMIRRVFLWNAAWIAGIGLVAGNALALGLILLQTETGIFTLNQEAYFLAKIPAEIDVPVVLLLNGGTLLICTIMLIVPSWLVSRISPVRAIRFE
jgi:lipoprotein-releasing system permease protein